VAIIAFGHLVYTDGTKSLVSGIFNIFCYRIKISQLPPPKKKLVRGSCPNPRGLVAQNRYVYTGSC